MIKAVVFDLDHTLYDRYETLRKIQKKIRNHFDINPTLSDEKIVEIMTYADKFYVHKGWDALQDYIINETELFVTKPEYDEYRKFVMGEFMNIAISFDFTIPMLNKLKNKGYLIGLMTNGREQLQLRKLELLGLSDIFDVLFISGKEGVAKPKTQPFLIVADRLGIDTSEMVYVGDNPENDIEASRNAGCLPIHVNTTGTWVLEHIKRPKYSVTTVKEIPDLIEKINSEL